MYGTKYKIDAIKELCITLLTSKDEEFIKDWDRELYAGSQALAEHIINILEESHSGATAKNDNHG